MAGNGPMCVHVCVGEGSKGVYVCGLGVHREREKEKPTKHGHRNHTGLRRNGMRPRYKRERPCFGGHFVYTYNIVHEIVHTAARAFNVGRYAPPRQWGTHSSPLRLLSQLLPPHHRRRNPHHNASLSPPPRVRWARSGGGGGDDDGDAADDGSLPRSVFLVVCLFGCCVFAVSKFSFFFSRFFRILDQLFYLFRKICFSSPILVVREHVLRSVAFFF